MFRQSSYQIGTSEQRHTLGACTNLQLFRPGLICAVFGNEYAKFTVITHGVFNGRHFSPKVP